MKQNRVSDSTTIPLVQFYKIAQTQKVQKNRFDPHQSPPDFEAARKHGLAMRICLQDQLYSSVEVCPCCGLSIHNQQIPLKGDLKLLSHLGVTFPLYFQYIKKCALLFVVQLLLSSFYNVYINMDGTDCLDGTDIICRTSIVNIASNNDFKLRFQSIDNLLTIFVLIILIELFRVHQEQSRYEIEKENKVTPADFTLQISGFMKIDSIADIESFFEQQFAEQVEICQIFCLLDMEEYSILYENKLKLIRKRNQLFSQQKQNPTKNYDKEIFRIEEQLSKVNDDLNFWEQKLQKATFTEQLDNKETEKISTNSSIESRNILHNFNVKYSGRLLVTLNNSLQCKYLVKKYKKSRMDHFWYWMYRRNIFKEISKNHLKKFQYRDNILRIKRAAEPSDINWMNVGSNKLHQKVLLQILILIIFLTVGYLITRFKQIVKEQTSINSLINILVSLGVSTVVALTNTLIGIIIRNFAGKETHKKQTNYYVSVGQRLSYLYLMNMVLTTVVANLLAHHQYGVNQNNQALIGMMNDFFFLFLTNTYLSSIFNYFDIVWGIRLFNRKREEKKGIISSLSQREANLLFEGHPVDMALRYANVVKVMFFTAAVSPLLPIGLFLSVIGLFILYWVDKYLLLRRYVSKNYLDKQLANQMMNILPVYTVLFSGSNVFIHLIQKQEDSEWSFSSLFMQFGEKIYLAFFGLIIAILYRYGITIGDFKRLYTYIFSIQIPQKMIIGTYQSYKASFTSLYEQYHPVLANYKQEGTQLIENDNNVNDDNDDDEENNDNELKTIKQPKLFSTIRTSLQQRA